MTNNNPYDDSLPARYVKRSDVEAILPDGDRILVQNKDGAVTECRHKGHLEARRANEEGFWCITVRGMAYCRGMFGVSCEM